MTGTGARPSNRRGRADLLPGLQRLRRSDRRHWGTDAVAGITVAGYLVPQVMGYSTVAGLPVATGLWAMIAALTVYVLVGSSPQLSVGPAAATALMTASVVGPLAAGDAGRYAALAAALALLVGGLCAAGYVARLGFLADLLSKPVLVGYMAGIAALMVAGQLERMTGVPVDGDSALDQVTSFAAHLGDLDGATTALALSTLVFLLVLGARRPRWPGPLFGVLLAAAAVELSPLGDHGIDLVGSIQVGLPSAGLTGVGRADLVELLLPALGVALVAFSGNVLTARAFGERRGYEVEASQELIGLGAANVASGLVGGFPVSSSTTRTAIADSMGAATAMCSVVALATTGAVMLVGRGLLAHFPLAALGAVVTFAAVKLVDVDGFRRLARFRRSEVAIAAVTTGAVIVADVLNGVLVAVALSIVDLVRRVARPHDGILGHVPGVPGMHDIDDYPTARMVPGLVVYRYDAPLCFANAANFKERALASLARGVGPVEWLLLNAEANVELDSTGLEALEGLRVELERRGVVLALARVKQGLRDVLERAGFLDRVGPDRVFFTLPTAVDAYRDWYRERHGAEP